MSGAGPRPLDLPELPALVVGQVHHTRYRPLQHSFTHAHYQWLIDLDDPPRLPRWLRPLASFRGEDHLAGEAGLDTLRSNVLRVLERHDVDPAGIERVLLLAHARSLGHVFDPMSVYWCLDGRGHLLAVLIEVHNTYRGRHAYVLTPDDSGAERGELAKAFHVSPFNDVEGEYAIRLHLSAQRVAVGIRLRVDDQPLLTASVTGETRPATPSAVAKVALRYPFMAQRVSLLIRMHGIWLWARRLRVRPHPAPERETVR